MGAKDTVAVGHNMRAAFNISSVWGTSVDVDSPHADQIAYTGIWMASESMTISSPILDNPTIHGTSPMQRIGAVGEKRVTGSLSFNNPYYAGMERLFALLFGDHQNDFGVGGGSEIPAARTANTAYYGYFLLNNALEGIMGCLVIHKDITTNAGGGTEADSTIWEFPSVKCDSVTIGWTAGSPVTIEFGLIASHVLLAENNQNNANDADDPLAPTYDTDRTLIIPSDFKLFIDDTGTKITATSATKLDVVSFSLTISRNLDSQISSGANPDSVTATDPWIDEPVPGFTVINGNFTLNKYTEKVDANRNDMASFMDFAQFRATVAGKQQKALLGYFESSTTFAANIPNLLGFALPVVLFSEMTAPVDGPGRLTHSVSFQAFERPAAYAFASNVPNASEPMHFFDSLDSSATDVAGEMIVQRPLMFYQNNNGIDPLLNTSGSRFVA